MNASRILQNDPGFPQSIRGNKELWGLLAIAENNGLLVRKKIPAGRGKTCQIYAPAPIAQEYVSLGNASEAYRLVYDTSTMTDEAVHVCASRLKAKVRLRIKELRLAEAEEYKMSRAEVLNHWMQIASANVNEIVQIRRKCCEGCYEGENQTNANPDCKKCMGEGESYIYIADTRSLTGAARLLYAGARKTKEGVEVILRDQDAALVNLARIHRFLELRLFQNQKFCLLYFGEYYRFKFV